MSDAAAVHVALKAPDGRSYAACNADTQGWVYGELIDVWLAQMLKPTAYDGFLLYNDEPPVGPVKFAGGHCKGIVLWNFESVVWLIHSVPKWPAQIVPEISLIQHPQTVFGQSFCLLTTSRTSLADIVDQVHFMNAHIYAVQNLDYCPVNPLNSLDVDVSTIVIGQDIVHIAKSPKCYREYFEDILAVRFPRHWDVETWSRPALPPSPHVDNCMQIRWTDHSTTYKTSVDHSKWAVCKTAGAIGDLNHMQDQIERGGGYCVIFRPCLVNNLHDIIKESTDHFTPVDADIPLEELDKHVAAHKK